MLFYISGIGKMLVIFEYIYDLFVLNAFSSRMILNPINAVLAQKKQS